MKKSKIYKLIRGLIIVLPLLLIILQCFRMGTYSFTEIEQQFSFYRTIDFGLSEMIIQNCFNGSSNTLLLLTFDFGLYYIFTRFVLFACDLFGMIILLGERLIDTITRGLN